MWQEMEKTFIMPDATGFSKVRHIGISNFNTTQIQNLLKAATVKPFKPPDRSTPLPARLGILPVSTHATESHSSPMHCLETRTQNITTATRIPAGNCCRIELTLCQNRRTKEMHYRSTHYSMEQSPQYHRDSKNIQSAKRK